MNVGVFIFVLLLLFCVWWWWRYRRNQREIPKIIYTFWHGPLTELVEKCIDSWKRHCPDYEIRILTYEDTGTYRHSSDSHQRHSDFVRLERLCETGGIWIDASVFLNGPLEWVHEDKSVEFVGYRIDDNETREEWPSTETWFMAVPKGSRFIHDWRDEFFKYDNYDTLEEYLDSEMKGVDFSNLLDPYLLVYVAQQKCVQKYGPYRLRLFDVKEDAFLHLQEHRFLPEPSVKAFCDGKYADRTRMTKLRRCDRPYTEQGCRVLGI